MMHYTLCGVLILCLIIRRCPFVSALPPHCSFHNTVFNSFSNSGVFCFLVLPCDEKNNYSFCLTREAFSMCFGARHHTQKLFSREQLSSSFHLCLLLFLCTLLLCCFFYLDARDQRKRRVSALRLTLLFLQTGMKHTGGKSAREKENSTAGFISSFSSV